MLCAYMQAYTHIFFNLNFFLVEMVRGLNKAVFPEEWSSVPSTCIEWLETTSSGLHGHVDRCMCAYLQADKQNYIYLLVCGGGSACMPGTRVELRKQLVLSFRHVGSRD